MQPIYEQRINQTVKKLLDVKRVSSCFAMFCQFQKPQKSMNRFEKQKRKFDEKKKLLNRGSQRAVGISIEGRKMAL